MKQTINVETTIVTELSAQDVLAYVQEKKLVPSDWKFYSIEVAGNGLSQGAKLTIKHSIKHSEAKSSNADFREPAQ